MTDSEALKELSFGDALLDLAANPSMIMCMIVCILVLARLQERNIDWQKLRQSMMQRPWREFDLNLMIILLICCVGIFGAVLTITNTFIDLTEPSSAKIVLVLRTIALPLISITSLYAITRIRRINWATAIAWRPRRLFSDIATASALFIGGIPLIMIPTAISTFLLAKAGVPYQDHYVFETMSGQQPLWLTIYFTVMATMIVPISEELLFRGFGLPCCARASRSPIRAMVLTSLLFALLHLNFYAIVPLFILSMIFSFGYFYTGSITVPILMHGMFNATSMLLFAADSQ